MGGWRASAGARRRVGWRRGSGWGVPPRYGSGATAVRVERHGGAGAADPWSTRGGRARGGGGGGPRGRAGGARPSRHGGAYRGGVGGRPPAARDGEGGGRRGGESDGTPPLRKTGGVAPATATACGARDVKGGGDAGHRRWRAPACTQNAPSVGRGGAARRHQWVGRRPHRHRPHAPPPARHPGGGVGGRRHNNRNKEQRLRSGGPGGTVRPPPAGAKAGRLPRDANGTPGGGGADPQTHAVCAQRRRARRGRVVRSGQ